MHSLLLKAQEFYSAKQYDKAAQALDEFINSDQKNADAFELRAMCYYHLNKLPLSLEDLNVAQRLEPNNPFRYSSRAYVKGSLKDIEGAIEDYKKAVHLDPEDSISHNNLGLLLEQKGYHKKAAQSFQVADDLGLPETENPQEVQSKEPEQPPVDEIDQEGTWKVVGSVLTSRNSFREFVSFVKNGFKIRK